MFYNLVKTPAVLKTGYNILKRLDTLLHDSHLHFPRKILITQEALYENYKDELSETDFYKVIFVDGGYVEESVSIIGQCNEGDALLIAFGGGSVLDIVKYCASKMDKSYITMPSTLSNDAIYSCVARLNCNGKKTSYGVQPPIGIVVDLDIIRKSPTKLILAGVADLVSNLSALQDWLLSHQLMHEPINELAYMLAKEAAVPILRYNKSDLEEGAFLLDLTNGLITSGLSMIISGNTRGTSGAEHLISHAIDEYFPEKSSIHGLQVGWAHSIIEKKYRNGAKDISLFFDNIGLSDIMEDTIPFSESDFEDLIPFALKIRNRFTVFNTLKYGI